MPKRTGVRKPSSTAAGVKASAAKRTAGSRAKPKAIATVAVARRLPGKRATAVRGRASTPSTASAPASRAGSRSPRVARAAAERPVLSAACGSVSVPVQVVTVTDAYSGDPRLSPGSAEYSYRFLAEGDSWFTIGGIPSSNLLYELRLPQPAIVCNIAFPGDTLKGIAELAGSRDFEKLLTDRFGYRWHAILLSAGGNDLMDRAPQLVRNPGGGSSDPRDYLVIAELENFVRDVQEGYRAIVRLRDAEQSANHGVPIVVHGYDYPTPRDAPARFLAVPVLGPWLHRAYDDHRIDGAVRTPITEFLVDVLAEAIKVLAAGPSALPAFHFVDTRGALQRAAPGATGASGDWLNEIHPSHEGYRKIAAQIGAQLTRLLAG